MVCDYEDWMRGLGHKRTWVTGWREVGDVWLLKIGLCVCDKDRRPPNLIRGNSLYLSLCWENPTPASHLSHLPYHRGVILNQSSLYFNTSCIMYLLLCIENFCHRISLFLYFCAHGVWSLSLDVRNSPQDLLKLFECDADSSYGLYTMGPLGPGNAFLLSSDQNLAPVKNLKDWEQWLNEVPLSRCWWWRR